MARWIGGTKAITDARVRNVLTAGTVGRKLRPLSPSEAGAGLVEADIAFGGPRELDVLRYYNGGGDFAPAVNTAVAVAAEHGGGRVVLPPGAVPCASSVALRDHVSLRGHSMGTLLEFTDSSLLIDATTAPNPGIDSRHLIGWDIQNILVSRVGGVPGYAVDVVTDGGTGASDNRDAVRFNVSNLRVKGSTGGGIRVTGAYLGAWWNTFVLECNGIGLLVESQAGTNNTALNASGFFGGEIQNCDQAAHLTRCLGVKFDAFTFEGNTLGIDIYGGKAVTFDGCYFEANGGYDLRVGNAASQESKALRILGSHFVGAALDYAIDLVRANRVSIESCNFQNYGLAGINRNGAAGSSVTGEHRNCVADGSTPAIAANENTFFHQRPEELVITHEEVWDPGVITVGGQEINDVNVPGVAVGDFVDAAPSSTLGQLHLAQPVVIAADTVRLALVNNSAGGIDLGAKTFRIRTYPRGPWFD